MWRGTNTDKGMTGTPTGRKDSNIKKVSILNVTKLISPM